MIKAIIKSLLRSNQRFKEQYLWVNVKLIIFIMGVLLNYLDFKNKLVESAQFVVNDPAKSIIKFDKVFIQIFL